MLPASAVVKSCRFLLSILFLSIAFLAQPVILVAEEHVDMPIGSVGGNVRADLFTGTATTSIPIAVPPGRKGIQPQLALIYGSANGNGWVGMGWKLEKSVIDRQSKFGLDYAGDDYRVSLSGINADLVNVGADEYRAKIEGSFTRVMKLTAVDGKPYFEATDKTGTKYLFGQTAASRMADPADASRIIRWCLDRVEDVHGNYMTISYVLDQDFAYLDRIDYTGNSAQSLAPTHSVQFHLEGRTDAPPLYYTKYLTKVAKRLKTIEVRANGNLVRAYKLTYTTSSSTQRSLLNTVQQFGKDATIDGSGNVTGGTSLPAVALNYQQTGNSFATKSVWKTHYDGNFLAGQAQYPDLNGDGMADLIYQTKNGGSTSSFAVNLSAGTGFASESVWKTHYDGGFQAGKARYPDLNGDGMADLIYQAQNNSFVVNLSTGNSFAAESVWIVHAGTFAPGHAQYADLNGDGMADLIFQAPDNGFYVSLSTGSGFTT